MVLSLIKSALIGRETTVVVWATYDKKETLYNFLETEQGKDDHGENEDMESIIESFVMYDLRTC
jgi:hypothetical protein